MENNYSRHSVTAIHKRSRSLKDLRRGNTLRVNLDSMLSSPLIAFLPNAVIDNHDTVETEPANHRLGYSAAGSYL